MARRARRKDRNGSTVGTGPDLDVDDDVLTSEPAPPVPKDRRRRSRRGRLTPRRWLPFLVFVALVAALVVADRSDDPVERRRW